MFQTLQETLYANSLEHKFEMQIRASLDKTKEESSAQNDNNMEC